MWLIALLNNVKKRWLTFFSPKPLLAIEISATQVKLLQLRHWHGGYQISHYACMPIPAGFIVNQEIRQVELLSNLIARVLQRMQGASTATITAIPATAVMTKAIQSIEGIPAVELAGHVQAEIEKTITKSIENLYVDYTVVGPAEKSPGYDEVLLIAAHNSHIDARVAVIENAGLKLHIIDVETYALQRASEFIFTLTDQQPIAIVDINHSRILIDILQQGKLICWYEEAFGLDELITIVSKQYHMNKMLAEEAIYTDNLNEDFRKTLLPDFCQCIVKLIQHWLQLFSVTHEEKKIKKAWVSGVLLKIPQLPLLLREQLSSSLEMAIANPLEKLALAKQVNAELLQTDAVSLMIVLGLALRGR